MFLKKKNNNNEMKGRLEMKHFCTVDFYFLHNFKKRCAFEDVLDIIK